MNTKLLHILFYILVPFLAIGQITISESVFPRVGDTLRYAVNYAPDIKLYGASTTSITWDFSGLTSTSIDRTIYYRVEDAKYGSDFQDAQMYALINGVESFYQISENQFRQIGVGGAGFGPFTIAKSVRIEGDAIDRRANVTYGDKFNEAYMVTVLEASKNLPDTIKNTLERVFIDSIRIEFMVTQETKYDAYGRMILPSGQVDVLRAAVSEVNTPALYAKFPVFGWQPLDVSQFDNASALAELIKERKTKSYEFHTNESKELAAKVNVEVSEENIETPTRAVVKAPKSLSTTPVRIKEPAINVFPNPTFGDIEFTLKNYPVDDYRVEIYNIVGKKIDSLNFKPGQSTLRTNLSHLRKGTYLYTIYNSKNEKITTRRLVIMTP